MQDCVKIGMWQGYRKQAQGKFDSGAILLPQPSCSSGAKRRVERTETDSGETLRADADAFLISEELKCLFEKSLLSLVGIYYVPIADAVCPYISFSLKKKGLTNKQKRCHTGILLTVTLLFTPARFIFIFHRFHVGCERYISHTWL